MNVVAIDQPPPVSYMPKDKRLVHSSDLALFGVAILQHYRRFQVSMETELDTAESEISTKTRHLVISLVMRGEPGSRFSIYDVAARGTTTMISI